MCENLYNLLKMFLDTLDIFWNYYILLLNIIKSVKSYNVASFLWFKFINLTWLSID